MSKWQQYILYKLASRLLYKIYKNKEEKVMDNLFQQFDNILQNCRNNDFFKRNWFDQEKLRENYRDNNNKNDQNMLDWEYNYRKWFQDNNLNEGVDYYNYKIKPILNMFNDDITTVSSTKESYVITVKMAGVSKSNIKVFKENGQLKIKTAYNKDEEAVLKYSKSFTLPEDVITADVKAKYKDGLLTVTIQRETPEEAEDIEIS